MTDEMQLAGKTAVVTGSSSGIGRAMAVALARAGADVLVHCRQRVGLARQTVDEIERLGRTATCEAADLTDADQRRALCQRAFAWRGGVDIWVNNAGADVLTGEAADWTFERKFELLWRVDVLACVQLSRWVGEQMRRRAADGDKVIINMGWDQAEFGMAGESGQMFAAIKGAVMSFTRSLAKSLAPEVRVNCLAPGWIQTGWGRQASEKWQHRARSESLMGRWGEAADVAQATVFLASPAARFITGVTLPVNGGRP